MGGDSANFFSSLKQAIEICRPNLRSYYRVVRKARVVASYPADGKYYADVQPLRNDESPDPKEPVVPRVEIPVVWGGPKRGIVCPPTVGTLCDLSYYDGDPNYPRISNFRWQENVSPEANLNELVIQQEPGVMIKIDKAGNILLETKADIRLTAGGDITLKAARIDLN